MSVRAIKQLSHPKPTMEGAGVRLQRAFGFGNTTDFNPFLLFDDFRNDNPNDYLAGFPWHPHRGIETITYVLAGDVEHGDSLGNRGSLGAGDVQWMTAGSGIMHQEMPKGDAQGRMHGFQLWSNLPSALKMTKPRYQDVVAKDIPEVTDDDGTHVRIVCGEFWGKKGPVDGVAADPRYLDVSVPPGRQKRLAVERSRHAFAYVFAGSGTFRDSSAPQSVLNELTGAREQGATGNRSLVLFDQGDEITVQAGDEGIRFLLVSGKPLEEPVAWYGPIVMNTNAELRQAQYELGNGTFIKEGAPRIVRGDIDVQKLWWVGPLTIVASNLAVLAVRVVAFATLDLSPEFPPLTYFGLVLFTTVLVGLGVLVFVVVARRALTPIRTYRRIALVAMLLSLVPDMFLVGSGPGATWPAAIVLMVMHVAAWLPTVLILTNPALVDSRRGYSPRR